MFVENSCENVCGGGFFSNFLPLKNDKYLVPALCVCVCDSLHL